MNNPLGILAGVIAMIAGLAVIVYGVILNSPMTNTVIGVGVGVGVVGFLAYAYYARE